MQDDSTHSASGSSGTDSRTRRRHVLKLAALGIGTSLAGCSSGGGAENEAEMTSSGTGQSSTNNPTAGGTTATNLSVWDIINVQSPKARETIENTVQQYESDTGNNVSLNLTGYKQMAGTKWKNSFQRGNYPTVFTSENIYSGPFIDGGWVVPFEDYKDKLSEETLNAMEWTFPLLQHSARFFGDKVIECPIAFATRNMFQGRMDHFKEAGIDTSRFPPDNYNDLIEMAKTLQQNGPADIGFQLFGAEFDWNDIAQPWAVAKGGKKGMYFNEDGTDTLLDNDTWIETARMCRDAYQEHGVSGPRSPSISDEDAATMVYSGKASMSMVENMNHTIFMNRAPDLMESGNLRYGNMWQGDSGLGSIIGFFTINITRPPEGAKNWQQKQQAGIQLIKRFLSKEFQRQIPKGFGILPIRDDIWESVDVKWGDQHKFTEVGFNMAKTDMVWPTHAQSPSTMFSIPGPYWQQMMKGQLTPEKAMKQAANEIRNQIL